MLSKCHSCFGVFAVSDKSREQLFGCTESSQTLFNSIPKLQNMRRNYSVEDSNSSSNPLHHSRDVAKLIFKFIFISQLWSVKYFISSSYYKVGRKKHFCINNNCCKSLFRNFILVAF